MQVGDLVINLNSESGLLGVVVDWTDTKWADNDQNVNHPVVNWNDGRTSWIMAHRVELVSCKCK